MSQQLKSVKFLGTVPPPFASETVVAGNGAGRVSIEVLSAAESPLGVPSVRIRPAGTQPNKKVLVMPMTAVLVAEVMSAPAAKPQVT